MKNLKNLLTAFLILFAVAAAYADNFRKPLATTYFAIQTTTGNPLSYTWQLSVPTGYSCKSNVPATSCKVVSDNGTKPADNSRPVSSNFHYSDDGKLNIANP